jgi:hypothetical protein
MSVLFLYGILLDNFLSQFFQYNPIGLFTCYAQWLKILRECYPGKVAQSALLLIFANLKQKQ